MTIECFLYTNIPVYAAIGKRDEPAKFAGARDLLLDLSFGVSARRCSYTADLSHKQLYGSVRAINPFLTA